jgi:NAD(P)-dependent dehydrogenase (short-subunit alcohol dehydrogenase family)
VAITSRDAERAGHAAGDLGPGALGLALDARDEDAVGAGVAEVWERLGGIDLLVNNAGTGMVPEDTPAEARERLLDAAIMGPPIVWLASPAAAGVHDERIVAAEFDQRPAAR